MLSSLINGKIICILKNCFKILFYGLLSVEVDLYAYLIYLFGIANNFWGRNYKLVGKSFKRLVSNPHVLTHPSPKHCNVNTIIAYTRVGRGVIFV